MGPLGRPCKRRDPFPAGPGESTRQRAFPQASAESPCFFPHREKHSKDLSALERIWTNIRRMGGKGNVGMSGNEGEEHRDFTNWNNLDYASNLLLILATLCSDRQDEATSFAIRFRRRECHQTLHKHNFRPINTFDHHIVHSGTAQFDLKF
ncbi:hypothetical protein MAC_08028 [Metarhizium acridum CQMa 102]|uniref:Uncharacterized protein n=1 Tax=Metarhizium acridum (strain CQMa 102) TaxID=655827 RepID=E9EDT0_METAQ|nr:uncharacterized protein MAC_08028 [Metarhizium acridum CQMa 102]EFY85945.1 hypothetical protein MAC_08028 [Metarhizium acridum CQMa 102]